jgi:hypothetical protein
VGVPQGLALILRAPALQVRTMVRVLLLFFRLSRLLTLHRKGSCWRGEGGGGKVLPAMPSLTVGETVSDALSAPHQLDSCMVGGAENASASGDWHNAMQSTR